MDKEICICAAVKDRNDYVWKGHRHCDCIATLTMAGEKFPFSEKSQGFVTSKNRFVTREEGYELQMAAGIKSASGDYRGNRLYSEDLY
ncbi:MAG: hypothetical protein WC476_11690 [Phycisphaerae bacterium]|jgi:hypothetical protein